MKALAFLNGYRSFSDRTRIDTIQRIKNWCDFEMYGPREHKANSKIAPIMYNETILCKDIVEALKPDVILLIIYAGSAACAWYPKDIHKCSIPIVAIDEDHWPKDTEVSNMYLDMGVDLLVRRHFYLEEETISIPSVWWPFSACEKDFYPEEGITRKNEIVFCGSSGNIEGYIVRRKAIEILKQNNLLTDVGKSIQQYERMYKHYVGGLTCAGSTYHTPMAKMFEMALSGTAILTNAMYNTVELFGNDKCYFEYRNDCSNVVEQANTILNDRDEVAKVTKNAMHVIKERHTDDLRAKELYNILTAIVSGKDIPRIWGQ